MRSLKISINSYNKPKKVHKSDIISQYQINQTEYTTNIEKDQAEKFRKEKKKIDCQERRKKRGNSPTITRANNTQAINGQKRSEIIARVLEKTFLRLSITTVIRRATIPGIILSLKTNYSLNNLYVADG